MGEKPMTNEYKDYLQTMLTTSESMKVLVEMTAEIIERELDYLDTMIDHFQEQKLFMGAVTEKLNALRTNMVKHMENVGEFVEDEEEVETLQ